MFLANSREFLDEGAFGGLASPLGALPPDRNNSTDAPGGEQLFHKMKRQNNSQEFRPRAQTCSVRVPPPIPPLAKFGFELATVTREFQPFSKHYNHFAPESN